RAPRRLLDRDCGEPRSRKAHDRLRLRHPRRAAADQRMVDRTQSSARGRDSDDPRARHRTRVGMGRCVHVARCAGGRVVRLDDGASPRRCVGTIAHRERAAMTEALLVSNVLLWIAVVALAGVVVALVRQIGVLHERVFPVGALVMPGGPKVGEAAPSEAVTDLAGRALTIGGAAADGRQTLLFFVSPTCPVCKTLLPVVTQLAARAEPPTR